MPGGNPQYFSFFQQIVRNSLLLDCKCHGLTGACSIHTCTRFLPVEFSLIAKKIFELYKKALQVDLIYVGEAKKELVIKKKKQGEKEKKLKSNDMAYLLKSRDFCVPETKNKLPGTKGRVCGRKFIGHFKTASFGNTTAINVCDHLCCKRGYSTTTRNIPRLCRCKFDMKIMDVKCKTCSLRKEIYLCR